MEYKVTSSLTKIIVLTGMIGIITGCAGGSDIKLSDAALSGDPDAMWVEGQQSVSNGEAMVNKGESRLAEGRQQVRDGEARISKGNQLVFQARQGYQNAVATAGGSSTPKGVEAEAKRLEVIGARWADAIDDIKAGNKLVDKGNTTIDKAQSEIRAGRTLMESGSTMMRNSQRTRLGETLLPQAPAPSGS